MPSPDEAVNALFTSELVGGWAGRTHAPHAVARPSSLDGIRQALRAASARGLPVIAKGAGCSYADQITNGGGLVIDCSGLSGIQAWDRENGRVIAWAGTSLADILRLALPAGWTIAGVPGSFSVTIGGAIANNVHGKDAHRWSFGSSVRRLELLDASGELRAIDATTDPQAFHGVIGGLGLLGIVVSAELQLVRIPSPWVEVETLRTHSLAETLQAFERREQHDFALAWLDGLPAGEKRGRGVIWLARWVRCDEVVGEQRIAAALTVNQHLFGLPSAWIWRAGAPMLVPPGLRFTNALYHALSLPAARRRRIVAFPDFYFLYNRINGLDEAYRPHGFAEVQAWFPQGTPVEVYRTILDILADDRALPIFTAMKGHTDDRFLLSFPGPGQSFTVGVPKPGGDRSRFRATLSKVFEHVIAAGGRVNLSKDEFLSADQFRRMYKGVEVFRRLKQRLDPAAHFQSDQYRRLFGET